MSKKVLVRLRASKTHKCRQCWFTQICPGKGVIELHQGTSNNTLKAAGKYLVEEHAPEYSRRFEVKSSNEQGGKIYWVSIGDNPNQDTCDCTGFESAANCKHADSIRALIDAGEFVGRSTDSVSCFYTDDEPEAYSEE